MVNERDHTDIQEARQPLTGQRLQGARRENDMGIQGGTDKERSFRAFVQLVYNLCRYEQVMRPGMN